MRVKWIPEAKDSLLEVTEYIQKENPEAAKRVISHIRRFTTSLSQSPFLGPVSTKFPLYRELVITRYPFVVWYRVEEDQQVVEIRLVWHSSQNRNQDVCNRSLPPQRGVRKSLQKTVRGFFTPLPGVEPSGYAL